MRIQRTESGSTYWRAGMAILGLLALSGSLMANVQEIRPRQGSNWGRDQGKGEINVRLHVDEDVEVEVRGDRLFVRTLAGRVARDAGSDLSASMPLRNVKVDFRKRAGRGRVWLVEQPSRANRFTLRFRISDPQKGEGRYHVRLRFPTDSWGWQDRRTAVVPRANPVTMRPSHAPVVAASWREDAWGRPSAWRGGLPGRGLDVRRRERVGDIHGRNGGRFEFRGRVDEEVLFFIRGNQVTAQTQFGRRVEVERWSLDEPVPVGRPLRLRLDRRDGRGDIRVLEEPHPRNNFTTVILVSDRRGGSDRYHFRLDWRR